ncbi:MAG TPA: tetratricopeptide repeat protein [Steroidobacteraceae bacterium]|nr:tetratricopeptide repeat protein [Steroidobacteraceae bacterium]
MARASAAQTPERAPEAVRLGALMALIGQGRLEEAEQGARALLRAHPASGVVWKVLSVALERQRKEPLAALERAAALLPDDAEAQANLGAALHDRGRWAEALESLERSLALKPGEPQVLIDAGNALRALGRAREALARYEDALRGDPSSAEAHNNLGNAYLELGEGENAVASYRRALELRPNAAQALCNLGNALRQLGRFDEALASSERALALDPTLSMAHNNLGLCLLARGERARAVASYREALKYNPRYREALINLGNVLLELGQRREALAAYREALDLDPQRAEGHTKLGYALFELRQIEAAAQSFRHALALEAGHEEARLGLAGVQRVQGAAAEAEASCRAVLAQDPGSGEALLLLGELHADRGRFDQALELFERALGADPACALAYCGIASHRRMTSEDASWRTAVEGLLRTPLPLGQEIALRYALGKYFDDLGQYDDAFASYRQANELTKRYGAAYDRSRLSRRVAELTSAFDVATVRKVGPGASDSELPVFIVGMPRSGTSLVEQILASHPEVFGAGEVRFWDAAYESWAAAPTEPSVIAGLARDYLARVSASSGDARRVIDKMPANFLYAGLIHSVFPRARIIHMRRDPLDTCLSIYFQNFFNTSPYSNDFGDLAHYYDQYLRIMRHWRAVLPAGSLLEVPYEALVADQEEWTRRMLEFVGLGWDARCLNFHQTERVVITASRWQVRQKLHGASAGRWRNYAQHIGPLRHLEELAAES